MHQLTLEEKLDLINQCATPQDLADHSLEILGNPMIVFDINMHVIAITHCDVEEEEYQYLCEHHYPSRDFTKEPGWRNRIRDMLRDDRLHVEKLDSYAHMHKVMKLGNTALGQLEIIDYFRPFTREDRLIVEVIGRACASAIAARLSLQVTSGSQLDRMVEYLLDGNSLSEEELLPQASISGWEPGKVMYLLCADAFFHGSEFSEYDVPLPFPGDRLIRYKNCLLIIVSRPRELAPEELTSLQNRLSELPIEFGLSRPFGSLTALRTAFGQAQNALDIGRRVDPEHTLYVYDRYLEYLPIMECVRNADALSYVMPRLLELAEMDQAKNMSLLYTLDRYIRSNRSVSRTAEALHLHRNTVNYRISKAMDFLGISLDDAKSFSQLTTSLRILEYLDRELYFSP